MRKYPIVALIYDFDGTLSPGNMQEFGFIQAIGKDAKEFWQESDNIALGQDASNILSYMHYETIWFAAGHLLGRIEEIMRKQTT